ncbi:glycosyltransferase family 2 protein [Acetobacteraceae bacterium KSS8]|uniref:Glycosyltransferase family 2 protein n=1 Tax=Endosaccharibacter trunci TaxID=2812733 RepID=A0ABT1W6N3_9PROT|nr:glycosyltransferase family 2 protein [Acetobacteraceae bacterium KSS8]
MSPTLSVVAAVLNEAENIRPVCEEMATALAALQSWEVVFVDDGSTDGTVEALLAARDVLPNLRVVSHDRRCGKSAALRTGIEAARGTWIATIDGDGQDDPREIPPMLALALEAGNHTPGPLVVGVRLKRNDNISRRFATRFANGLRRRLLRDGCPDTGAPMKLFRREDFLRLPQFEGVHRFLPALFQHYGSELICKPVHHRARLHGASKYTNLNRAIVGIRDMMGVIWLQNRTRIPGGTRER